MRAFEIEISSGLVSPGLVRRGQCFAATVVRRAHWLSLDVVAGALAGGALAAAVCRVDPQPVWWGLLASATWIVYTLDRLLDVRRPAQVPGFARHRFHRRHRRGLALTVALVAVGGALAALTLPPGLLAIGSLLAAGAAAHLALAQRAAAAIPKEFSAALIYVAAIWYVPLVSGPGAGLAVWSLFASHLIAALANLVAFGLFELEGDRRDGRRSLAIVLGEGRASRLLDGLSLLVVVPTALALWHADDLLQRVSGVLLFVVALVPWILRRASSRPGGAAAYRAIGDGAFLLLALVWWLR